LSLGTYVFGKTAKMGEARFLADALFTHNPYRVKRYHNVWGKMDLPPGRSGRFSLDDDAGYFVLEQEPQYMELNEQLELSAQKLNHLRLFEFLLRPATREGEVSQSVIPISIEGLVHDQETGEFLFPDRALVDRLRAGLAANTGIPLASILKEQEARLLTPTPQQPDTKQIIIAAEPVAASESADGNGRQLSGENQPVRLENGAHPEPHTAKKNPSLPIPDDTERQFLSFISEHPDTPVSELYKALGVGVWKGNKIRESLKAKGLLAEVELRTGSTTAGRPAKFVILTFQAFQLFGIAPPHGRGGVLHRHLQHDIADRATGKGYTVTCEKVLDTGAIVDVHLEKGQTKIAVEIAVLSTPDREIGHIRNCLTAGYDQVYGIFADDELLARTATTLRETFSVQETERVRLMSLRQLPHVGEG
jgi:hypothetical protein